MLGDSSAGANGLGCIIIGKPLTLFQTCSQDLDFKGDMDGCGGEGARGSSRDKEKATRCSDNCAEIHLASFELELETLGIRFIGRTTVIINLGCRFGLARLIQDTFHRELISLKGEKLKPYPG
jgi:hypothetical protein